MHTARRDADLFRIECDGQPAGLEELLPGWSAFDRIGFVCTEPLGVVGAGLLVQAASTAFFAARPARRDAEPQYPEIYCFHVGGPFGDHSMYDFVPPRKEVFVEPTAPALLAAINDRAITRLVVPEAWLDAPAAEEVHGGGAGWSERSAFGERVVGGFGYAATGRVTGAAPDVTIGGDVAALGSDADNTFAIRNLLMRNSAVPIDDVVASLSGPATRADYDALMQSGIARLDEVTDAQRDAVARRRQATIADGWETQTFRRASPPQLLEALAAGLA